MKVSNAFDATQIRAVGIQLYNRIDYARACLEALALQTHFNLETCAIHILVDKPSIKLQESRGFIDNREDIVAYALSLFPNANFILPEFNLGIANSFLQLQKNTFESLKSGEWAFFVEEDIILSENHLSIASNLIQAISDIPQIQKISLFQGVYDLIPPTAPMHFGLTEGTKAFAMSKELHLQIQNRLDEVFTKIYSKQVENRHRIAHLLTFGIHVTEPSKDFVVDECIAQTGAISLLWNIGQAIDIGEIGEGGSRWFSNNSELFSEAEILNINIISLNFELKYELPRLFEALHTTRLNRAIISEDAILSATSITKSIRNALSQMRKRLNSLSRF